MIIECPRCHRKNRLPDALPRKGVYRCSHCQETLVGAGVSGRVIWLGARLRTALTTGWRRPPMGVIALNLAYMLALLALGWTNAVGPEGWWFGSLNLYLPQWLWAVPGAVVLAATVVWARRWAWVPILALLWVFGPVMGLCWHWGLPAAPSSPSGPSHGSAGIPIRVMTYNVKWGSRDGGAAAVRDIAAFHPDLIQMQDSGGVMDGEIGRALAGWNVRTSGQYLIASRHPLPLLETRDISFSRQPHHCVRYLLQMGTATVVVYDVHLLSPREGLVSARRRETEGMEANAGSRLQQAGRLADMVEAETGPVLLTGDLNAPMQSLVCRRLFGAGLRDAFSESGFGYGYTYGAYTRVGQPYVRIDHILASKEWRFEHCWVGNSVGSDHCPVIADLVLPAR